MKQLTNSIYVHVSTDNRTRKWICKIENNSAKKIVIEECPKCGRREVFIQTFNPKIFIGVDCGFLYREKRKVK